MKITSSTLFVRPCRSSLFVLMLLRLIGASAIVLVIIQPVLAQKRVTAAEAKDHIGETATLCGNVVSTGMQLQQRDSRRS